MRSVRFVQIRTQNRIALRVLSFLCKRVARLMMRARAFGVIENQSTQLLYTP